MLEDPQKIFDVEFFQFFEKLTSKLASWDLANIKGNKVRKFGSRCPYLATAADGFMVGGAIMPPPPGPNRVNIIYHINHFSLFHNHKRGQNMPKLRWRL